MTSYYKNIPALSDDAAGFAGFQCGYEDLGCDDKLEVVRRRVGAFGIHLFGHAMPIGIAVWILPGKAEAECPVVQFWSGMCYTMTTSARESLGHLIFYHGLGKNPDRWKRFHASWNRIKPELEVMNQAIGGGDSLVRLESILHDDHLPGDLEGPNRRESIIEILMRIDPSTEFRTFLQWFVDGRGAASPLPLPEGLGS
jgi:hypothetical protein